MPGSFPQGKSYVAAIVRQMAPKTALDIGPGVGTYAELFRHFGVDLDVFDAVEVWEPYIGKYHLKSKYSTVHLADAREWDEFDYDLVVFGDVLEHMTKEDAAALWEKVSKQAKYAIISIPIVHLPQGEEEGNPYEVHVKDDWTAQEVLDTFPHIGRYNAFSHIGVFVADFSYDGEPVEDKDYGSIFPENPGVSGGTEIMVRRFRERILPDMPKLFDYRCLVIPGGIPSVPALFDGTPTIVWLHLMPEQMSDEAASVLRNPLFQQCVKFLICVSEWHRNEIIKDTGIDPDKVVVIQNAVDPAQTDYDRFDRDNIDKVQIIHASTPDRGMEVLIPAIASIPKDFIPFELKVFNIFDPDTAPIGIDISHIVLDPRITYYGRTPHATVIKYMAQAHIHAYPAYWLETSCMVQIEALTAGCLTVVSDRAVLPETSMGHSVIVNFTGDRDADIQLFANNLANAIKIVKSGSWQPHNQSEQVYRFFSWERAKERWLELHDRL